MGELYVQRGLNLGAVLSLLSIPITGPVGIGAAAAFYLGARGRLMVSKEARDEYSNDLKEVRDEKRIERTARESAERSVRERLGAQNINASNRARTEVDQTRLREETLREAAQLEWGRNQYNQYLQSLNPADRTYATGYQVKSPRTISVFGIPIYSRPLEFRVLKDD